MGFSSEAFEMMHRMLPPGGRSSTGIATEAVTRGGFDAVHMDSIQPLSFRAAAALKREFRSR